MKGSQSTRDLVACLRLSNPHSPQSPHSIHQSKLRLPFRPLHTSTTRQQRRKPRYQSLSQAQIEDINQAHAQRFRPYTEADKGTLARKYNKEQLAAIEAGEAAISADDLANQAQFRRDALIPTYLDDFSRIEPVIDKKIEKLRGEGQDYENSTDFFRVPTEPTDFADIDQLNTDKQFMGKWRIYEDANGDEHNVYEGRERELDYFAEKEFKTTPECDEMITKHLARVPAPLQATAAAEAGVGTGADAESVAEVEAEAEEEVDGREDESEVDLGVLDFKSHPKYQEIRARLEAAGPMRRKYGFGTTPQDRAIDRIIQGVEPDVAPEIPKIRDPMIVWSPEENADEDEGDFGGRVKLEDEALLAYQRVSKQLGMSIENMQKYRLKTLVQHRVVNQTRLGKIQSIYTLVVAGNQDGMLGIGEGKGGEHDQSRLMAQLNAIRSMVPILRYENRTIYGEVMGKSGATVVKLSARRPGFGVRTNQHIFEIARCAGLSDLAARVPRSRNAMNVAKAVWQALRSQRDPEDIARGRGKKLVDVRKVYYSGLV